jgi:hypothetical protein
MLLRLATFVAGVVAAFFASLLACVWGIAAALHWPLSEENLEYALVRGACWGVVGGLLVGLVACRVRPNWRASLWVIGLGSLLWAAAVGFCFSVYVAAVASV